MLSLLRARVLTISHYIAGMVWFELLMCCFAPMFALYTADAGVQLMVCLGAHVLGEEEYWSDSADEL